MLPLHVSGSQDFPTTWNHVALTGTKQTCHMLNIEYLISFEFGHSIMFSLGLLLHYRRKGLCELRQKPSGPHAWSLAPY